MPMVERQHVLPGCGLPTAGLPPVGRLPTEAPREGIDYIVCTGCGEHTDVTERRASADNHEFCRDCYGERFVACAACERETAVGSEFYAEDSYLPHCEACYMSLYSHCSACGAETETTALQASPIAGDAALYCSECFSGRFTTCCGCGQAIIFDDVAYTDEYDGDAYCANCSPCDEDDDEAEWEQGRRVDGTTFDNVGSKRKFGVELEISGCRHHGGLRGKTPFGVKYDGSLSSGKEFVSPVLQGDEGLEAVSNLCAFGREHDWTVDSSCGYHVHVDCGDLNNAQLASVAVGYTATEDVWARFVSKKRAGNSYCDRLPYSVDDIRGQGFNYILERTDDRYHWLNWQAYQRHHTVEIRLHSGTTNYDKVANWVKIHTRFVDALAKLPEREVYDLFAGKSVVQKFAAIMDIISDDGTLRSYYMKRAAKMKQPIESETSFDRMIAEQNLVLAS